MSDAVAELLVEIAVLRDKRKVARQGADTERAIELTAEIGRLTAQIHSLQRSVAYRVQQATQSAGNAPQEEATR